MASEIWFDEETFLDKGVYGMVYDIGDGRVIKKNVGREYNNLYPLHELSFLHEVKDHPSFVQLSHVVMSDNREKFFNQTTMDEDTESMIHFVLEKMEGTVDELKLADEDIKFISMKCLLGLEYLESKNIGHFDIKPSNILYQTEPEFDVKICDFGIAEKIYPHSVNTYGVMSPNFRAPEICLKLKHYFKSDIWSLGCTLYELIHERSLINLSKKYNHYLKSNKDAKANEEIFKEILKSVNTYSLEDLKLFIHGLSETTIKSIMSKRGNISSKHLLDKMLQVNPDKRSNATELLDDPYFDDHRQTINKYRQTYICKLGHELVINPTPQRNLYFSILKKQLKKSELDNEHTLQVICFYDFLIQVCPEWEQASKSRLTLLVKTVNHIYEIIQKTLEYYEEWDDPNTEKEMEDIVFDLINKLNGKFLFYTPFHELSKNNPEMNSKIFKSKLSHISREYMKMTSKYNGSVRRWVSSYI